MNSQKPRTAPSTDPIPDTLESAQAKLVYLFLDATDGATVDDLEQSLATKKIDILSILQSLRSEGLVEKSGDEYVVRN
ncbi:MarR family transcriptional regulator [Salinadaptatus halalkaliphilus]|uniref:MarR family transcriptional regulator n=1 Tax=Salinadaptatus halalkaliphilus TaxID=2419781 RepID=A0A4V3VLN1_9EURY|nr:MarR family transcriptional regulator [Salinadaptatus halalkaliphilus]THE66247.1 MarR family transcriptional regulator [Salinadaptatus halalkaliphilus]